MSKRRRAKGATALCADPGIRTPSPLHGEGTGGGSPAAHGRERRTDPATRAPSPLVGESRAATRAAPAAELRPRFWETIPLDEMTGPEWEALCDGCGKCCLLKLEDADTGRVHYTNVTCRLFDCRTRRCGQYALRRMLVPGCIVLTPENLAEAAEWMPASCAYRRLHERRGLADWHPLVSGDRDSVRRAGQALTGRTMAEYEVAEEDLEDHIRDDDILTDDGDTP